MNEASRVDRPRQVTMGAAFAIVASALLVASAFDAMGKLRSVDTRAELTKALDSAAARGLGISVDQATDVLHALLLISGGGAAVAGVLAVFAMLGNTAARTTLTVLAVVVLLSSAAVDPLLGVVLAFAVGMLWSRQARDWFAGRAPAAVTANDQAPPPGQQPGPPAGGPAGEPAGGPAAEPTAEPSGDGSAPRPVDPAQPPPTYGYGGPAPGQQPSPAPPYPAAPPYPPAYPYPPSYPPPGPSAYPASGGPRSGGAPGPVRTAALLTWVFSGLALAGFVATALALLVAHDDLVQEITRRREYQDLNLSETALTTVLWVVVVVLALWALAACVLAFFVWRGHSWARVLLAISAVLASLFCLLTVPISVVHLVASAAVVGLLFSPASNQWFRARSAQRLPPPPTPPSGPPSPW